MTRLPELDDASNPALAARIRAERGGKLLSLYRVLMHSPRVAQGWLGYFTVIRQQCALPARDRELAILQVAVLNRAPYEFEQHIPFARDAGVTGAQIEAMRGGRTDPDTPPRDRAVIDYATAMTRDIQVPDGVFEALRKHLPADQIVELTATVAGYNMVSRFLEALEIHEEPSRP
ncbi:MAG: carboxymuconolactone decarboxylase family protein [Burkholderiales bacterium]